MADKNDFNSPDGFDTDAVAEDMKRRKTNKVIKLIGFALILGIALSKAPSLYMRKAYKSDISELFNGEYKSSHLAFTEGVFDGEINDDDRRALKRVHKSLDEISAVKVLYDKNTRQYIDSLVAEEKQFLSDLCRCMEIYYSDTASPDETAWAEAFMVEMRRENKLYHFREEIGKLIS